MNFKNRYEKQIQENIYNAAKAYFIMHPGGLFYNFK